MSHRNKAQRWLGGRGDSLQRLKTPHRRKPASARWLQRHLNDPYVLQARREGYASRAAYKLLQLDDKYQLLKPGLRVVDLGAAPGGWAQVAASRVESTPSAPQVVALDVLPMQPVSGVITLQADIEDADTPARIHTALGGWPDVVLSDMAPNTTGHSKTDHLRIVLLCEQAFAFATESLTEGGAFVCKVRQGGTEASLLQSMKQQFRRVTHMKPEASRQASSEVYVVSTGFRRAF